MSYFVTGEAIPRLSKCVLSVDSSLSSFAGSLLTLLEMDSASRTISVALAINASKSWKASDKVLFASNVVFCMRSSIAAILKIKYD